MANADDVDAKAQERSLQNAPTIGSMNPYGAYPTPPAINSSYPNAFELQMLQQSFLNQNLP